MKKLIFIYLVLMLVSCNSLEIKKQSDLEKSGYNGYFACAIIEIDNESRC